MFSEGLYAPEFVHHPTISQVSRDYQRGNIARYGMGGTSFLGHPSVFHAPAFRRMRRIVMRELIVQVFREYITEDQGIELLLDRIMVRPAGDAPPKESWHRDVSPYAMEGDEIFGGWLNLDENPQYFSCVPGSAGAALVSAKGFLPEELAGLPRRYEVPPGGMILFREDILHEVVATKLKHTSIRLFHAFRVSTHIGTSVLGSPEDLSEVLSIQPVLKIKSGQLPTAYPQSAVRFPLQAARLEMWLEEMVVPDAIDRKTRSFRSLGSLKVLHPKWTPNEIASLLVSREHVLADINGKVYRTRI
jgi:hypothetical protein